MSPRYPCNDAINANEIPVSRVFSSQDWFASQGRTENLVRLGELDLVEQSPHLSGYLAHKRLRPIKPYSRTTPRAIWKS